MKFPWFILMTCIFIFINSCSTKKDIIYMQDIDFKKLYENSYNEYQIKVDDILKIDINAEIPEATLTFNPGATTPSSYTNTLENMIFNGYQVDIDGNINFPVLGKIKAQGLTINELKSYILNDIENERDLLVNPSIDIKILNSHFTVLGEVNQPGKYNFVENNLNILEALGIAGDLTINGKRESVKLLREINGKLKIFEIDLTNVKFLTENFFQISSGDILIVDPNSSRIKNAGVIGNSGTLLSLLSFILSSIIVISN